MIYQNIIDQIGHSPMINLGKLLNIQGEIYGKMEYTLPGGSVKDRAALQIIKDAKMSNLLQQHQPVIAMTSGNMGAGLAIVCRELKHPFTAVMSEGNSINRVKMLKALGATVELVPQVDGEYGKVTGNDIAAADKVSQELARLQSAFYVDQFSNYSSVYAHYSTTGPEISGELGPNLSAFVNVIGSGATFIGCSRFFKETSSTIKCFAVEPENASWLKTGTVKNAKHIIQGTGYGITPLHWDNSIVDDIIGISDEEATYYKELLGFHGVFVGYSSGANVAGAIKTIKKLETKNFCIATILCDTGFKY